MKIFLLQHSFAGMFTAVHNINLQLFNDKLIRVKGGYPKLPLGTEVDKEDC